MNPTIHVARSHGWLHDTLHERARPVNGVEFAPTRADADVIVHLDPPWPDPDAPEPLRAYSRRELARTLVFSQSDHPTPWAPGMYASLRRRRGPSAAAFAGGFYVLHHLTEPGGLREHLTAARGLEPDLLWSFVGTVQNAPVRRRVAELRDERAAIEDTQRFSDTVRWNWTTTHRDEAQEFFQRYAGTLGRSKFVLCPRGRGLSSIRIFEALELGRCPVILSDGWLPPPFVDWDACSIRIRERDAGRLPEILREREPDAEELGKNARRAWEERFSPETQLETLVRACLEIRERIGPATRLLVPVTTYADRGTVRRVAGPARSGVRRLRAALRNPEGVSGR